MSWAERKRMDDRTTDFQRALEVRLDQTEWCFAYGVFSQDVGGWYVSSIPRLTCRTGVVLHLAYKPMAADRLFWDMVGLSSESKDTLSFRNRRLWTLQAPQHIEHLGEGVSNIEELAEFAIDRTQNWLAANHEQFAVSDMLKDLSHRDQLSENDRMLAICLAVLADDDQAARRLVIDGVAQDLSDNTCASTYGIIDKEGCSVSLLDKAKAWLVAKRRDGMKLIN